MRKEKREMFFEAKIVTNETNKFKVNKNKDKIYIYGWSKDDKEWEVILASGKKDCSIVLEVEE